MSRVRKTRVLNCRVTPEHETALAGLAALHGLTKSEIVRRLVVNAAATPEPVRRLVVAPTPEPVRQGKAPTRT